VSCRSADLPSAHLTQAHTHTLASTHVSTQRTPTPTQTHTHVHLSPNTPTWFPLWVPIWDIRTLLSSTPGLRTTGHPYTTTYVCEGAGITASPIPSLVDAFGNGCKDGGGHQHQRERVQRWKRTSTSTGTVAKMEEDINMNGNGCKDGGGNQHQRERVQRWRKTSTSKSICGEERGGGGES